MQIKQLKGAVLSVTGSMLYVVLGSLFWQCPAAALPMDLSDPLNLTKDRSRAELVRAGSDLYNQGQFAEAETIFRQALKEYPKDAVLHYKLGNALFRQTKLEEAAAAYQQAVEVNPNYAVAYNALGIVRQNQDRMSDAIAQYRQALTINHNYAEAMANLGQALWQQGSRQEAISSLQKAKNLFKQQGRMQESQRIERFLQQISIADPSIS